MRHMGRDVEQFNARTLDAGQADPGHWRVDTRYDAKQDAGGWTWTLGAGC